MRWLWSTWWTQDNSGASGNHHPWLSSAGQPHVGLLVARLLCAAPGSPSVPPLDMLSCCFALSSLPPSGFALHLPLEALRMGELSLQTRHKPVSLIPKLSGASPLIRAAAEPPMRGLEAEGRAAKQGGSFSLLDPMGFWVRGLPGMPARPEGLCSGTQAV